jgi:hypothetical protein
VSDLIFTLVILGFFALTLSYAAWCVGLVGPLEADQPSTGPEVDGSETTPASADAPTGRRSA